MSRKIRFFIILLLAAFGTWFYFTPHLSLMAMKSAAEARDAAKFSSYVNFPALKESLKASFNAKLASEASRQTDGNRFATMGAVLAASLINPMIDALVTPENLAMIMHGEKPQTPPKNSQTTEKAKPSNSDLDVSMSYESFDRFVVTVKKKTSSDEPIGLVFNRDGLFSWKLSALRLPM